MKTLKNVESMYRDYEEGSLIVIDKPVSVDALKSFIADAMEDVREVLKSVTPGSSSKLVSDSKKYGHGVAEESDDGYSRQMVEPKHQGTKADPNAVGAEEGAWDRQRQSRKEREERGETPEKGWRTKKSISSEDAAGIIETVLAIKSIIKSFNPSDHKTDKLDMEADKHEEMEKLRVDLNKEEDAKKTEKSTDKYGKKWDPSPPSPELTAYDKKMESEKRAISDKATAEGREMTKQERDKYQKAHMD
jgi:hypothetical protein